MRILCKIKNRTNATAVKIAQIVNTTGDGATPAKMRAIYNNNITNSNNNNMIQHENGVTTIVPASSLAATTQTAAMNAVAPSTVTITPAPHIVSTLPMANNLNGKKKVVATVAAVTAASNQSNIIDNIDVTHLNAINNINNASSSLNQKLILVKTTPTFYNNNSTAGAIN